MFYELNQLSGCVSLEEACFAMYIIIYEKRNAKGQFAFGIVNGGLDRSRMVL